MLEQVIKGCRKRDRKYQKELYKMFYAYGMSIALRYTDTREQAVAILNDSFMKVFDQIHTYDTDRPFKPWFRRIVINTAINHYHKYKKEREWTEFDTNNRDTATEESITGSLSYTEIIEMIRKLTPVYRTVFNMFVIEGFTHKEIAVQLGIAEGTSKSNLSKAKKNLRSMLEEKLKVKGHDE